MEGLGMKKLLFFIGACFGFMHNAFCQDYISEYQRFYKGLKLGSSTAPKTIELASPQINPTIFNGMNTGSPVPLDQAEELVRSLSYTQRTDLSPIPHWDSLMKWSFQYLENGILPLLLVDFRYELLSDSFWVQQQYGWDTDSGYLVKKGPWKPSNFRIADAFCFVPMVERIHPQIHSVVLDTRFYISHRSISEIRTLGGDVNGAPFKILPNQPCPIGHILEGINNVILYIETDSSNERFSINKGIQMNVTSALKRLVTRFHLYSNPKIPDWQTVTQGLAIDQFDVSTYVTAESGQIVKTGAKVSIHYSHHTPGVPGCLNKPIVFVEGIDFGYRGWPTGCRDGKCGNTGYIDLLKGKQWDVESQSWLDWNSISSSPVVLKEFRDSGYDIVYIDFWDGADFIENNAVVVAEAIKQIEQRLCGQRIHVLGASMGALVAKRALTMLENDTIAHCIESYISFDGPHIGANIPLGLQAALQYYSGVSGKMNDLRNRMLNRPASKQMLLIHYENIDQAHEYHKRFLSDSLLQAYPSMPWRFAIVNGSNGMTFQESDNLVWLGPGDSLIHFNIAQPLFDNIKSLAKLIGGKTLYAVASVLPQSDATLFAFSRAIMIGKDEVPVVATFKTTYKKETPYVIKERPENLDHIAGGKSDIIATFHNALRKQSWLIFSEKYTSNTCFIPTWSSIASDSARIKSYIPLQKTIGDQFLNLRNTPFHNYYSQSGNQDHVYFDDERDGNAFWLLKQLIAIEKQHLPATEGDLFFGRPYDRFMGNIQVPEKTILNVNGNVASAKLTPIEKSTIAGLKNRIFYLGNCQPVQVSLNKNSSMELHAGATGKQPTQLVCKNKSKITVDSGSVLWLRNSQCELLIGTGSQLELLDGSTLIIENGARVLLEEKSLLTIGKNVTIKLNGENAMLHIKGLVTLSKGAQFSVRSDSGFAVGMLKLSHVQGGFGQCKFVGNGNNTFYIQGNDAKASAVLQIEGEINHTNVFDTVLLHRAHVRFGNHSRWVLTGTVEMKNCGFYSAEWAKISQNGISVTEGKLTAYGCLFQGLNTGLQWGESCVAKVTNGQFQSCTTALLAPSSNFFVEHCKFLKNTVGVEIHGSRFHDSLIHNQFSNNVTGITVLGDIYTSPLHCNENEFYANTTGIETQGRSVALRCNVFGYNSKAINATECDIIAGAHSGIKGLNDTLSCGNNTFAYSQKRSIQLNFSKVHLDGENNFLVSASASTDVKIQIAGTVPNLSTSPWNTKNTMVNLGNNHWHPLSSKGNMDTVTAQYLSIGTLDLGGRWYELNIAGTVKTKLNTLCFDPTTTLDVARRAAGLSQIDEWTPREVPVLNAQSLMLKIPSSATVFGMDGRQIAHSHQKLQWSDGLSTGFYLVRFQQENGDWVSRRVFYSNEQ